MEDGAQSILLDLRHNPGGFFPGGIDVARYDGLFLHVRVMVFLNEEIFVMTSIVLEFHL